jgi:hypothetical protein
MTSDWRTSLIEPFIHLFYERTQRANCYLEITMKTLNYISFSCVYIPSNKIGMRWDPVWLVYYHSEYLRFKTRKDKLFSCNVQDSGRLPQIAFIFLLFLDACLTRLKDLLLFSAFINFLLSLLTDSSRLSLSSTTWPTLSSIFLMPH